MPRFEVLLALTVGLTLAYDFTNGFNDLPKAIATVVSTRIMGFPVAVLMAGTLIFLGAYTSTGRGAHRGGKTGANRRRDGGCDCRRHRGRPGVGLVTWWLALPSSSSHALIGGLCGASIVRGGMGTVVWERLIYARWCCP